MYNNEFQKRGFPHSQILAWIPFNNPDSPISGIDSVISAEIPDKNTNPLGHALDEEFMIHGPCGKYNPNSPCMKDESAQKDIQNPFVMKLLLMKMDLLYIAAVIMEKP